VLGLEKRVLVTPEWWAFREAPTSAIALRKPMIVFFDLARVVTFDAEDAARVVEAIRVTTQALIDDAPPGRGLSLFLQ
jgi:hypothetical protein